MFGHDREGDRLVLAPVPAIEADDAADGALVDDLLPFGGGDEQHAARELAKQASLPYLDDQRLVVDESSVARVGVEEVARLRAVPVRGADGGLRIVVAEANGERFAAVREHFSTGISIGVVTRSALERLLESARRPAAPPAGPAASPAPWGQSLERVLGLVDDEAVRLQVLRHKMQQLGSQMSEREQRLQQLETDLARAGIDRLRDQETIDRLRHELAERDGRLERAMLKAQELTAIIDGGGLR